MASRPAPRIVSLVPSLTELLFALGLGPWVVARTGFCIHPAGAVARVPKVGGTKSVNFAKLKALAPTHVLVNVDENRREDAQALAAFVPQVVVTHPLTPADIRPLIATLWQHFGHLPGVSERAAALDAELTAALALAPQGEARRVLYLIWRDPWMAVARDTYIAAMLAQGGFTTLPAVEGGPHGAGRYPPLAGNEPWLAQADEVWLSSEPYRFGAADVPAAQALAPRARVRLVDGELLSWYGPRAAAGLAYLQTLGRT